jgi:MFS family permease
MRPGPDAAALIAARAVQGAGAATIMPMALALLNGAFPPARRGWAIGIYGGVTALAALAGPLLGGAVTQGLGWQWIFWLNVPVALAESRWASAGSARQRARAHLYVAAEPAGQNGRFARDEDRRRVVDMLIQIHGARAGHPGAGDFVCRIPALCRP